MAPTDATPRRSSVSPALAARGGRFATTAGAVSASAPTPTSGGGDATAFAAALADLPAAMLSADGAVLYYTDRALAWQRLGVGTDTAERLDAIGRTFEEGTYSQPPVLFAPDLDLDRSREEIGFTTFDIERGCPCSRHRGESSSPTRRSRPTPFAPRSRPIRCGPPS